MSYSPTDLHGPYRTVFDVGAFRGDFARACLAEWPGCEVLSFEPLEPRPKDVSRTEHWYWFVSALGSRYGTVTMHRNIFIPSSSILEMASLHEEAFPYTRGSDEVQVEMDTLAEFKELIVGPALLKIDVQGYELEVLKGAGDALPAFDAVVLEVSHALLYHGAPTYAELDLYLTSRGFEHEARVDELRHPKSGELLQSDELWIRP